MDLVGCSPRYRDGLDIPDADLADLVADAERDVRVPAGSSNAGKAVAMIMAAYRTPDFVDPAAFVKLAVQAIEEFPAVVIARLASPKVGIIRESKFPPSIAELVAYCERERDRMEAAIDSGNRISGWRERAKIEAERKLIEAAEQARLDEQRKRKADEEAAYWASPAGQAEKRRQEELAAEAERTIREATQKRQREEAVRRKRMNALAALTKAVMAHVHADAEATEKAFELLGNPDVEATAVEHELTSPGLGSQYVLARLA